MRTGSHAHVFSSSSKYASRPNIGCFPFSIFITFVSDHSFYENRSAGEHFWLTCTLLSSSTFVDEFSMSIRSLLNLKSGGTVVMRISPVSSSYSSSSPSSSFWVLSGALVVSLVVICGSI